MGCDIHAYVEVSTWTRDGKDYWDCKIENAGGRDYLMFGIMAGVRVDGVQEIETRGLPPFEDLSWRVQGAAFLRVNDQFKDDEGYCSEEDAERYTGYGEMIFEGAGSQRFVTHPDWHSRSWMTADELARCLGRYMLESKAGPYDLEWDAILAFMRTYEERGAKARLVFWFDN